MSISNSDHLDLDLHAPEVVPCDHDWIHINDSFDHEFGTEQVHSWECSICGLVTDKCPTEMQPDDDES